MLSDNEGGQLADIACDLCNATVATRRSSALYLPHSHALAMAPVRQLRIAASASHSQVSQCEAARQHAGIDATWREQMIARIRERKVGHHGGWCGVFWVLAVYMFVLSRFIM